MDKNLTPGGGSAANILVFASFGAFGVLAMQSLGPRPGEFVLALGLIWGLIFAYMTMKTMTLVISIANRELRQHHGPDFARRAVSRGLVYLVPFAALAVVADRLLHWPAVMLFASAGIMTAGASVGAEIGKIGRPRMLNFILPSIAASVLAALWTLIPFLLSAAGGVPKKLLGL